MVQIIQQTQNAKLKNPRMYNKLLIAGDESSVTIKKMSAKKMLTKAKPVANPNNLMDNGVFMVFWSSKFDLHLRSFDVKRMLKTIARMMAATQK